MKRKFSWYRAGPIALLFVVGCGEPTANPDAGVDLSMTDTKPGPDGGGDMASGGASITPATTGGDPFSRPVDSVPTADGTLFFFLATGSNGAGVFKVPAGGGAVTQIVSGPPLVAPQGISISTDGTQLYIADPAVDNSDGTNQGNIFVMNPGGSMPSTIGGVGGTRARGIDVAVEGGKDVIWFTGIDPADGAAGVFKIAPTGGTPTTVVKTGLNDPSGIAVTSTGSAYVADTVGGAGGKARIVQITGGQITEIVTGLPVGYPAGVALDMAGKVLAVSGQDPVLGTSVVFTVDLATKNVTSMNKGIENSPDSGGLHRAANSNVFSWCGVTVGTAGEGTVFRVTLF